MEGNNERHCSFNIMERAKSLKKCTMKLYGYCRKTGNYLLRVLVFRHDLVHVIKILRDNWQLMLISEPVFEAI